MFYYLLVFFLLFLEVFDSFAVHSFGRMSRDCSGQEAARAEVFFDTNVMRRTGCSWHLSNILVCVRYAKSLPAADAKAPARRDFLASKCTAGMSL